MRIGLACDGPSPPQEVVDLLAAAGLPAAALRAAAPPAVLVVGETEWLLAGDADVLRLCAAAALDAAVVGKAPLLEGHYEVSELLDLGVCRDVLVYAAPAEASVARARLRVATRYPRVAARHFDADGRQVDLLTMRSPSLAAALGLVDGVVDLASRIVPTSAVGAEPLVIREEIAACSARLVAGRASRALLGARLGALVEPLRTLVEDA